MNWTFISIHYPSLSNATIFVPFIEKADLVHFFPQTLILYFSFSIFVKLLIIHKTLQAYKRFKANSSHKKVCIQ